MGLRPGYKPTELGVIPEDWVIKQIEDLNPIVTSGSRGWAKYYSDSGSPFIRITNLTRSSLYLSLDDLRFVTIPPNDSEGARTQLQNGDVLVSITADIGIVGYVSDNLLKPSFINQHIALVRFDASSVCAKFVSYFLASERPQKLFRALTDSGAKAGMNLSTVQQVRLALPSAKAEQEAIAEILSDADALIESLEQLLAKKRQIKQGAMQRLLTGKERLPGFNGDWESKRLDELGRWTGGMTPSMRNPDYWQSGVVPWISSGDVKSSRLHDTAHAVTEDAVRSRATILVAPNSIVIVTRSGILRKYLPVAMNMIPMAINQDIKALLPHEGALPDYLLHVLIYSGDSILAQCLKSGTTVESIEFPWLKAFQIPIPRFSEQIEISEVLNDIDAEIAALGIELVKARQIKQGMMQELLTGRIRLVRPSAEVIPFKVGEKASSALKTAHNAQINEAVVLAVLTNMFGTEKFPLGRFRRTKFSYLLHRYSEHEATGFQKKAAGPYNPSTRYGGAEKIALQNGYVRTHKNGKAEGFVAADKIAQAEGYFETWYGSQVLDWLGQFRYKTNDELELLTTVDMASEDLRREGKEIALPAVKRIIRDHPEWKAKLNRAIFSDGNITSTIEACKQLFSGESQSL